MITEKWPLVRAGQIHVKDPKHPLAVLTCWTRKDTVIKLLDEAGIKYNSVGQLYTERGYSPLVRNLLANRHITTIVICGKDLSGAGKRLEHDINFTFKEAYSKRIKEWPGLSDIPSDLIADKFEKSNLINLTDLSLETAIKGISRIKKYKEPESDLPWEFPEPEPKTVTFPSAEFGHVVRGNDVPETYLKMLDYILRFGKVTDTHYNDPQKEVLAMTNIVLNQPNVINQHDCSINCQIPDWMPENSDHLQEYITDRILSGKKWPDLKYTYGNLIHDFNGNNQLHQAANKMVDKPDQRSCVISLWDPTEHSKTASGTPCLNHIQFRMRNGLLMMHALIRSNDMFAGWPENAYALRALQEMFLHTIQDGDVSEYLHEAVLGPMAITSISAHLYRDTWDAARELVDKHLVYEPWKEMDEKGQLEVMVENGKIIVSIADGRNELERFEASTAKKMCHLLSKANVTDNISNAMYIAREVTDAEHHIKGFRS